MKPNLISYNIIEKELKKIQDINENYEYKLYNILLVFLLVIVFFMIFYVFRDKKTKNSRKEDTVHKLKYILDKSNHHIKVIKENNGINISADLLIENPDSYNTYQEGYI
tara:strand:- start:1319 stop:1645 length:327 start_codon:yes stop_codon:yes gene_type:complete